MYISLKKRPQTGGALQNTMKIVTKTLQWSEGVLKIGQISVKEYVDDPLPQVEDPFVWAPQLIYCSLF